MLILRRKKNESILIGDNIRITLLECASDGVRIAIDAPKQISIIREELSEAERINKEAISPGSVSVRSLQVAMANYIKSSANSFHQFPGVLLCQSGLSSGASWSDLDLGLGFSIPTRSRISRMIQLTGRRTGSFSSQG